MAAVLVCIGSWLRDNALEGVLGSLDRAGRFTLGESPHRRQHGGRRCRPGHGRLHATQTAITACARLPSAGSESDWKKRQREVFGAVMTGVVPNVDPTGRPLRKTEQRELIDYCWENPIEFMSACPTIAVDDALCEARISDPKRKPQKSDGIDLAHAVMALGYPTYARFMVEKLGVAPPYRIEGGAFDVKDYVIFMRGNYVDREWGCGPARHLRSLV
jgi:hypothetical protein